VKIQSTINKQAVQLEQDERNETQNRRYKNRCGQTPKWIKTKIY